MSKQEILNNWVYYNSLYNIKNHVMEAKNLGCSPKHTCHEVNPIELIYFQAAYLEILQYVTEMQVRRR